MVSIPRLFQSFTTRWRPVLGSFLSIILVVALATFAAHQSRLGHERLARISAANLSQVLANHITSAIGKIDLSLNTIAVEAVQQANRGGIDGASLSRLLAQQKLLLSDVGYLLATDAAGRFQFGLTEGMNAGIDVSDRGYFRQLRDGSQSGLVIDGPYYGRVRKEWVMIFARRLNLPDGTFAGVVAAFVNAAHFEEMLSSPDLGDHGSAILRTANLDLIASFPKLENVEDGANKLVSAKALEMVRANPEEGSFLSTSPIDGIERSIAYRRLNGFPLYAAVGLASQDYLVPWRERVIQLIGIVAVFSLVILWLSRDAIRAADRVQATNRLLREAVENSAVGLSIFDSEQRLVICNEIVRGFFPEFRDTLKPGATIEDIMRTGVLRGKYPEARDNPEQWIRERVERHQAADGQPFEQTLSDGRQLLIIEKRAPSGHIVSNRIDITELTQYRQRLEQLVDIRTAQLKVALDQFRILVELSPSALAMVDRDLRYLATSRSWLALYGQGRSNLVGEHMYHVTPDFPESWKAVHRAALAGAMDSREEDRWVLADGSERWVRWAVGPWAGGSKGDDGGIVISTEDITDRKRAEQQLLEREAHFRATFEQAGVGVCHATLDGRFLRVNDKYCAILGYDREELLDLRYQDVTHPEDLDPGFDRRAELMAGAINGYSMEKRYIRKDGSIIWVNVAVALVRKANGEPDYSLAVIEDIQQRKEMERALAAERRIRQALLEHEVDKRTAELQAANQKLEGFVYASSHDLRGPLGRISSFSTLLEKNYRDRLDGDGLLFLNFIRDNAQRLTTLIDDLLAHALVDQRVSAPQPIDLRPAVQATLREKAEEIREAGASVRLDLPEVPVLADAYGLSQVLHNLLENALKYSAGEAEPVIEIGGEASDGGFRLWVRDNGIGFDMEYRDKIFEIFRRLHTHAEYAGSGVGLALVKRAMERMGGRVWAEGEPGRGATFYLEFSTAPQLAEA